MSANITQSRPLLRGQSLSESRRRVVVTGLGAISPLGDDLQQIYEALLRGERGLSEVELFSTSEMGTHLAGEIRFDPKDYLTGNIRPIDRTGRLAIIAAQRVLEASGWSAEARQEQELSLVLGTMFGSVRTIAEFDRRAVEAGPKYAKPFEFANSVINAAAGQTAIRLGLRGVNSTVAGGASAGVQALASAVEMIRNGRADVVLAGGGEELCFESFLGYDRSGRLAKADGEGVPGVPFAAGRRGFLLGEGAVLFMLEEKSAATARGAKVLAEIRGHGNAYDCSRGSDADQAAGAICRSLAQALDDADLSPAEIDVVSAAANGSVEGDAHEAHGLAEFFAARAAEVPVMAVKGQLGESLGASGAFQTGMLLMAMHHGKVPGIVGLEALEDGFPLAVSQENREAEMHIGLVHGHGFDGNSCGLVLEKL